VPSFYKTDGTFIPPVRQREYYVGLPGSGACSPGVTADCLTDMPDGMQIVGGNSGATAPSDNQHVYWQCGRKTTQTTDTTTTRYFTPPLDHPYDCTAFDMGSLGGNWDFVDGPVGVVDLPRCWDGTGYSPSDVVYPEQDGGSNDFLCEGTYATTLPLISIRTHIGSIDGGADYNPCTATCRAYIVLGIGAPYSCANGSCLIDLSLDHTAQPTFSTNDQVAMFGVPNGPFNSQGGYTVVTDDQSNYKVTINIPNSLPLPQCPGVLGSSTGCGTVADDISWDDVAFKLAGGTDCSLTYPCNHTHYFYDLDASFWNTWQQDVLGDLELYCLDDTTGANGCLQAVPGEAVIGSNRTAECVDGSC